MKHYKLTIPGLLPGLNEYVDAERGAKGKYKAAAMKKQAENVIGYMIKTQLRGVRFTRPVVIHYTWIEPNRRRDKDNIAFAKKFIQDSLVHAGVLQNDGWKHIEHFTDDFAVDPKNPRVEVVRDPELKYTPQGTAVTSFTLDVDRRFNRDKADYINIIAWRQTAEFVAKHFAKGQRVAIVGSIQTRSWEDNDGGKHKAVEIVADSVYFADAKKESAAGSYAESAMTSEGFEVTDEDIPF